MQADVTASPGPQTWTGLPPAQPVSSDPRDRAVFMGRLQGAPVSSLLTDAVLMEAPTPSPQDALGPREVPMCIPHGGSSCFLRKKTTFVRGREPEKEVRLFPLFLENDSSNNTTYCKILKEKNTPPKILLSTSHL